MERPGQGRRRSPDGDGGDHGPDRGVLAALFNFGSYGLAIFALSLGTMAHVSALRETSVIIAALIGAVVLKEPFGRSRIAAAALVATGVATIHLAG